jgi:hypothetical protein
MSTINVIASNHQQSLQIPPEERNMETVDEEYKRKRAWKYAGYPEFSKWMSSSNDFFLLRRFDRLNTRVLLLLQDRIVRKEEELDALDAQSRELPDDEARNDSLRYDTDSARERVLDNLSYLLKQYSKPLSADRELHSLEHR